MKVHNQVVPLSNSQSSDRIVKSGALMLFRAMRSVADYASQLPDVATQVSRDVADAWRESSRPNV